jgi:hypothetical protein
MPEALRRETALRQRAGILFRDLAGEAVLLDPHRGTYFGLNAVGTTIWTLLAARTTLGDLHAALLLRYDATAEEIWRDLLDLVGELERHGLVEIDEP